MRQVGRSRSLAAENRVRRPRRRTLELGRRDAPHAAVEPGFLEDRLGEVGPRALAVGGDVPQALRQVCVDERSRRVREMADERGAATLVVHDRDLVALGAEAEHRAKEVVPGRPEEPRRADRPTPAGPPPLRRGASSGRTRTSDSARPTRRTASACGRRRRSRSSTSRVGREVTAACAVPAMLTAAAPCGSASAPSTSVQAAVCRTRSSSPRDTASLGGDVTSQSARVSARTSSVAKACWSAWPSWPPAPVIRTRRRRPARTGSACSSSIGVRRADRSRRPCARRDRRGRTRP